MGGAAAIADISADSRVHANAARQCLLHWTPIRDFKESFPLIVGERTSHMDFSLHP
jgi:hypothetical protein